MNEAQLKIYQPDAQLKMGFFEVWREMFEELIKSRELIWRLFIRDFLAKYRQSVLGVVWALIMPIVAVGTFVLLNRFGVLNIGDTGVPYPLFALLGLTIWQLFATGLTSCSSSIVGGGSMVIKINFPKESLVIASLAQSISDFVVRIALLIVVFAIYGVVPAWTILLFPFTLIPLILLTLGLGFLLSLSNVIMRDVTNVVTLLTTFLLFLTPVLYPPPLSGLFTTLNTYNLLTPLVTGPRDLVILGYLSQPSQFLWVALFSFFTFVISWWIFHLAEPRMAERI